MVKLVAWVVWGGACFYAGGHTGQVKDLAAKAWAWLRAKAGK